MSTFITQYVTAGDGVRLAVKDLIDMSGEVTTAGSRAVEASAEPATRDARCLAGARLAGARIVGRTNLHELALGVTGINPWFGTPVNPLDPARVPGGSSSGAAVAVATGAADVAFGTDTGGSVRIPACCGVCGLKTTTGRIPTDGVWPLAPSFDTVGPLGRTVSDLVVGMTLLEPGFALGGVDRPVVGRLRLPCEQSIESAIDAALARTGWEVRPLELAAWDELSTLCLTVLLAEAWASNRALATTRADGIGTDVLERLRLGGAVRDDDLAAARRRQSVWTREVDGLFSTLDLVATPTIAIHPPRLRDADALRSPHARCTLPVNFAGVPAVALPVAARGPLPASLQLIGPRGSEEYLLAAALDLERAARR